MDNTDTLTFNIIASLVIGMETEMGLAPNNDCIFRIGQSYYVMMIAISNEISDIQRVIKEITLENWFF